MNKENELSTSSKIMLAFTAVYVMIILIIFLVSGPWDRAAASYDDYCPHCGENLNIETNNNELLESTPSEESHETTKRPALSKPLETEPTTEPEIESTTIDIPTETKEPETHITESTIIPTEPTTDPVLETESTEQHTEFSEEDVELLAIVIFQEAGADYCCDNCRRRVADVVLNRVECEYYPDTIYDVLMQESQYGRFHWTGVVWPYTAYQECNAHAVERARRIAREVLSGQHSEIYGDSYYGQAGFVNGSSGFWCCGIYFARFNY